jgi:hypothetical protein
MAIYKTGFYMVNGVKMYYNAVTNGTLTPTQLDALANPVASWVEPDLFPGGSFSVAYAFKHTGAAAVVKLYVAIGNMVGSAFNRRAYWFSPTIAITLDNQSKDYSGAFTFTLPSTGLADPPVNYSMYCKVMDQNANEGDAFFATSPTYDNAMNLIAAGFSVLTIASVTKVTTP